MKSRKKLVLGVLALIALASGFGVFWEWRQRNNSDTWFSSPTASRESIAEETPLSELLQPQSGRHIPPSGDFSMLLEPAGDNLYSVVENGTAGEWAPEFQVIEAGPDQKVTLPGGVTIELVSVYISVVTSENLAEVLDGQSLPFRFFDSKTLQQLQKGEAKRMNPPRSKTFSGGRDVRPIVGYFFQIQRPEGSPAYEFNRSAQLFNSETGIRIGRGGAYREEIENGEIFLVESEISQFHSSSLAVQLMVADPPFEVEVPPEAEREFRLGPAKGRVAIASPGFWFADSDEVMLSGSVGDSDLQFSVLATFDHAMHRAGWAMHLLGEPGIEIRAAQRKYRQDRVRMLPLETNILWNGQIRPSLLRFRLHERFHHLFFRIHSIPDLPKYQNLFDVRIPSQRFRDPQQALSFVSRVTQMQWSEQTDRKPKFESDAFPMTFEDTTPREILDYLRKNSNIERIWTDSDAPLTIHYRLREENEGFFNRAIHWLDESL